MTVAVLELKNDKELGKYASVQLEEFGLDVDRTVVEQFIDLPGVLSRKINNYEACMVLADVTDEKFLNEVIGEIISIETRSGRKVEKLFKEKGIQDKHSYGRELKELASQKAEKLAEEIR